MKASVGAIFQALLTVDGERQKEIAAQVNTGKKSGNYGRLLVVSSALEEALKECDLEVDLSPYIDDSIVVSLLVEIATKG